MDTLFRRLRVLVCLGCCAGVPELAAAQATYALSAYPTGFAAAPGGGWVRVESALGNSAGARVWQAAATAEVTAVESITVAGRAGALATSVASGVTARQAGVAVARCVLLLNPYCLIGSAAVGVAGLVYADYRIRHPSQVAGSVVPAGVLDYDPGQVPVLTDGYQANGYPVRATAQSACEDSARSYLTGGRYVNVYQMPTATTPGGLCRVYESNGAFYVQTAISFAGNALQSCPASVDALNPAYSIPAGGAIGPDGKCPTARYNHVAYTPEQSAERIALFPPPASTYNPATGVESGSRWAHAVADAIDKAGQTVQATPGTVSGPASQSGTPLTSTEVSPSGTKTTTTTPTYNYTYSPTTINYTTSVVTTVNNAGAVTTTTTSTPPPTTQDPTDPCTANPGRIGCSQLGSVAQQPSLYTKQTKTFSGVLTAFKSTLEASPLGSAMTGFFTVSMSGGTCPTWQMPIEYLNTTATIDFMCSSIFMTLLTTFAVVLNIVAGFAAFRIAFL